MAQADEPTTHDAWVLRFLAIDPRATSGGDSLPDALARWSRERAEVLGQLKDLELAIRVMGDPLGDAAIILVRAISANLTERPDSKNRVAELRAYLTTDSIIDDAELENGFGIDVRIRAPLLPVLDALDRVVPG
jgi:hypothetical protein